MGKNKENTEKKKDGISVDIKKQIIDDIGADISYDIIQAKYNLKNKSNISQIWKLRDKYLAAYQDSTCSPLRKSLKTTKLCQIDVGLTNFINNWVLFCNL